MELIVDKRFSVGAARLEGDIVALIRQWALDYPHELVGLDRDVKVLRRMYREGRKGMSEKRTMMHTAEIPTTLANRMVRSYGKHWSDPEIEPEIWRLFKRNFTVGMIRR